MAVDVHFTSDAAEAEEATRPFLEADPVRHNVVCSLLRQRRADAEPVRYWWAVEDDRVAGAVFQSPFHFPASMSVASPGVAAGLAGAVAATDGSLPGLMGMAEVAAAFAGEYATITRRPARPVEGQRIYEVRELTEPDGVPGGARLATEADAERMVAWVEGFYVDTDAPRDTDPATRADRMLAGGNVHLWEVDGEPRSCAVLTPAEAGVARVGFVYTPPEHRCRGYAAAITAELSRRALEAGERCILYTQLSNPTSNAVYQRLGYRAVAEVVRYAFDPA